MTAQLQNLTIEQGATFQQAFIWQDVNGNPIDLTTYHAKMQIRTGFNQTATLIKELSDGSGITLDSAGNITLQIDQTATEALDFNQAVYDLFLWNGTIYTRLLYGIVSLIKSATVAP